MTLPPLPTGWTITHRSSGIVEYVCPHRVGHPVAMWVNHRGECRYLGLKDGQGIHGCDGCCQELEVKRGE